MIEIEPIRICRLSAAPFAVDTLEQWFVHEWPPYYGPGGAGNAGADLLACLNDDKLPIAVVALGENDQVLGTAALKADSLGSELGYGPWLAALLIAEPFRRQGIGNRLIERIEMEARRLGLASIYASTDTAVSMLARRNWKPTGDEVDSLRGPIRIFRLNLDCDK